MIRWIFLLVIALSALQVSAQELTKEQQDQEKKFQEAASKVQRDTTKPLGWAESVIAGVNFTQASFSNWVQGGQNALSYTLWFNGSAVQNYERTNWSNTLKLAFGQSRLGGGGLRKTDDEIYFETLLIYKLGMYINPYASATARTQFATGYTYDAVGTGTAVSAFMDPGFFTQSVGAAYTPVAGVKTRIGVAMREVVTSKYNQYSGGAKSKMWGGGESVTDAEWDFAKNMKLNSRLELFVPFTPASDLFVRFDNSIAAKVNDYVNASFNVQMVYDGSVSGHMQVKEVLAIGLSYQFM
jgi:hypothetical protein